MPDGQGGQQADDQDKRALGEAEDEQLSQLTEWQAKAGLGAFAKLGPEACRALEAAARAVRDEIERGELADLAAQELRQHCESVLEIHTVLIELARICKRGSESGWPSPHPSTNGDVWQSTYEKLAIRISDRRIDITRPLRPLARVTARRLLLSEYRRQKRLLALSDLQLHRFNLADAIRPDEQAEVVRKRTLVRTRLAQLQHEGRLSDSDLGILEARYVNESSSAEVAAVIGSSPQNVRQICTRRCALLRLELGGLDLEEGAEKSS